jgi:broad specificity phosphatase PhoE
MPRNLVFIRHGQSEANVIQKASKEGSHELYTDEVMTVPDRSWRLTDQGEKQAMIAGEWLRNNLPTFDRYVVSPFTRTRETAKNLQLENPRWEENRTIRERSWGEIDSISRKAFRELYPHNANLHDKDPLYWAPPAGESIANVSENRVSRFFDTLHRENGGQDVLAVTHGEFIWASRLTLERWSDEEFMARDSDPNERIHNCMTVHYTRVNPETGEVASSLRWVRKAWPIIETNASGGPIEYMYVTPWEHFERPYYTNEQLAAKVENVVRHFPTPETVPALNA